MNWLLKLLPESLVESFVRKQSGVWINKGLQAVAVYLVSHKLLGADQQGTWIATNADWLVGVVLALVSGYITKARGDVRKSDLEVAHQSDSTQPLVLPAVVANSATTDPAAAARAAEQAKTPNGL